MPTRLTLEFFGETQVDRSLETMELRSLDARPAWETITDSFLAAERRQFETQGLSGSGGWPPLSPAYGAWKAKHFPGMPILQRTRRLALSLTEGPAVRIFEPHDMWIGSDVYYGAFHQAGAGVPQRRPVDLTETWRRSAVHVLHRHIVYGEL